ncbi:hypothetical protein SM033_00171 [Vibrio phage vB_VpaM_sm033]|nr:hypothetical protein SM033_00171 [Vibrio phage vB_VpaM_sm033]
MLNRGKFSEKRGNKPGYKKPYNKNGGGRKRYDNFDDVRKERERPKLGLERPGIDVTKVKLMTQVLTLCAQLKAKRSKFPHIPRGKFPANAGEVTVVSLQGQVAWLEAEIKNFNEALVNV